MHSPCLVGVEENKLWEAQRNLRDLVRRGRDLTARALKKVQKNAKKGEPEQFRWALEFWPNNSGIGKTRSRYTSGIWERVEFEDCVETIEALTPDGPLGKVAKRRFDHDGFSAPLQG